MFMMKGSILMIIKNHDRRNNSVFKHGIIPSIKLLVAAKNRMNLFSLAVFYL